MKSAKIFSLRLYSTLYQITIHACEMVSHICYSSYVLLKAAMGKWKNYWNGGMPSFVRNNFHHMIRCTSQ